MEPYYQNDLGVLYHGDCLDIIPHLPKVDLVLTDPPYPNNANHFSDKIDISREVIKNSKCPLMTFWTEIEIPINPNPLVAVHIWYRSNTNRPDNYEPIFYFNEDGKKRASKVLSFPVVYLGMTGMKEATEHPTQKNQSLTVELIKLSKTNGTILDPFVGSGTTAVACEILNRKWIGIEISERYCEIAAKRIEKEKIKRQHLEENENIIDKIFE